MGLMPSEELDLACVNCLYFAADRKAGLTDRRLWKHNIGNHNSAGEEGPGGQI